MWPAPELRCQFQGTAKCRIQAGKEDQRHAVAGRADNHLTVGGRATVFSDPAHQISELYIHGALAFSAQQLGTDHVHVEHMSIRPVVGLGRKLRHLAFSHGLVRSEWRSERRGLLLVTLRWKGSTPALH